MVEDDSFRYTIRTVIFDLFQIWRKTISTITFLWNVNRKYMFEIYIFLYIYKIYIHIFRIYMFKGIQNIFLCVYWVRIIWVVVSDYLAIETTGEGKTIGIWLRWLSSLGSMGAQLRTPLKPPGTSQHYRIAGFKGALNWFSIMSRDVSLSDNQCEIFSVP